jgi:hypothetical protein
MEYWNVRIIEEWDDGTMGQFGIKKRFLVLLPNIPVFQYS